MALLGIAAFLLAAYLMGSLPSGYVICRWVANIDVRTVGSKNIGATNVARSLGSNWGLLVLVTDMAKGALPVLLALSIWSGGTERNLLIVALVALAAFFGHLFSASLVARGWLPPLASHSFSCPRQLLFPLSFFFSSPGFGDMCLWALLAPF